MTRIAWCLEQASEDNEIENIYAKDYFKQCFASENDKESIKDYFKPLETEDDEPRLYELMVNEVSEELKNAYFKKCEEIYEYKDECKNEALDLIKKYFFDLWD